MLVTNQKVNCAKFSNFDRLILQSKHVNDVYKLSASTFGKFYRTGSLAWLRPWTPLGDFHPQILWAIALQMKTLCAVTVPHSAIPRFTRDRLERYWLSWLRCCTCEHSKFPSRPLSIAVAKHSDCFSLYFSMTTIIIYFDTYYRSFTAFLHYNYYRSSI